MERRGRRACDGRTAGAGLEIYEEEMTDGVARDTQRGKERTRGGGNTVLTTLSALCVSDAEQEISSEDRQ